MSELLTHEEYRAIAAGLTPACMAYIDGKFCPAESGETLATLNPATGETLAQIAACAQADVDKAVGKARAAFDDGRWSQLPPGERKAVLIRLGKLVKRDARELAVLESLDSGKPISDCEQIDIPEFVHTLMWHAEAVDKLYDQAGPYNPDALSLIVREPVGVVGAVLPWNFPLLMLAWKIAPALASGCTMVVKPAEQTSLTALRIAELASEAGLPRGVLNIVTGTGAAVGEPLGRHRDVDMISFTGSTATGRRFLHYAADSNLKNVVLECGGKNPCIVLDDAEHLDQVAEQVVMAAFWNMGENCSAGSRLIVHQAVKDDLLQRIDTHLRQWRTGDPLDPETQLGALIDERQFAKVSGYLDTLHADGLTVLCGGESREGRYVLPTIVDGVPTDHALAQEEIFGPILSVISVNSLEQALEIANHSDYGLSASIFTRHGKRALRAARAIRAGTVTINCFGEGDISTPFGGYKQSGFGGRDNGLQAHEQYTEVKTIWVDLSDRAVDGALD